MNDYEKYYVIKNELISKSMIFAALSTTIIFLCIFIAIIWIITLSVSAQPRPTIIVTSIFALLSVILLIKITKIYKEIDILNELLNELEYKLFKEI